MRINSFLDSIRFDKSAMFALVAIVIVFFITLLLFDVNNPDMSYYLAYNVDFIVFYGFFYFVKKEKTLFNLYSLFWLSVSLFSFGHVILFSFGLDAPIRFIFDSYPLKLVNEYMIFGFCSFVFLFFSGVIVYNLKTESSDLKLFRPPKDNAKWIFLILAAISTPFYIYKIIQYLKTAALYGYGSIYEIEGNIVVTILAMWFIPSIFGSIYCYKNDFRKYVFVGLLIFPIISFLIIGGRGAALSILMCLMYLWNATVYKLSKIQTIFVIICGLFIMVLIPSIGEYRSSTNTLSFFAILNDNIGLGFSEVLRKVFGELGGTAQIWLRLQNLVPIPYEYKYGFSYVSSILCCIPSFLLGGFSFAKYANLSEWITKVEGTKYGLGFSMLGEAYYNFGWFGIIDIFFVGLFMFYIISCKWLPKSLIRYKYVFSACALYIFATTGRDSLYLGIRHVLYMIILPTIIIYLTRKKD